eukprot:COSAG06_NODE_30352_length_540_cov_1.068027_1_plen_20_part_10
MMMVSQQHVVDCFAEEESAG